MARAQQNGGGRREERNALVIHQPRLPAPDQATLARFGLKDAGAWKTLVEAVWPSAKTVDGVAMALDYCRARGLDPFKKPVHIVPMYNSTLGQEVETVWPGIQDYRTTASRTGIWAGNDDCLFGPTRKQPFKDSSERGRGQNKYVERAECEAFEFPEWAQVTVYKIIQGQRVPFVGPKVRFVEIFSGVKGLRVPNDRWRQAPWQMLEKCAEAAALRRAFPEEFGGTYTAEEMEGKTFGSGPLVQAEAVLHDEGDQGASESRPTRETVVEPWREKGIRREIWEEIERQQLNIDATGKVGPLRNAKEHFVDLGVKDGWQPAELDELEARFDKRIDELDPPAAEETPVEGDGADASTDKTDGSAKSEEEDDEQTD